MSQRARGGPGLFEKAHPGVHDAAFEALTRFSPPPGRVLDLGAGTGAWASRLQSAGYELTPVDCSPADWALESMALLERDLNRPFADSLEGPFDVITSVEVIEHLESPWLFLRECRELVTDDGIVLVTTPNIENLAGRIQFFLTGHLRSFGRESAWNEPTHITPIQTYLFEKMYTAAGLTLAWHGSYIPAASTREILKRLCGRLLRPVARGITEGENHVFVLRRKPC